VIAAVVLRKDGSRKDDRRVVSANSTVMYEYRLHLVVLLPNDEVLEADLLLVRSVNKEKRRQKSRTSNQSSNVLDI